MKNKTRSVKRLYRCFILIILITFICPEIMRAQWEECFMYKGEWSSWTNAYGNIEHYADESGIVLKTSGGLEYFRFRIQNYLPPTKEQLKEHLKSGECFEYTGIVDYCVNDMYPTAEAIAKSDCFVKPDPRVDKTPTVMRSTTCRILIRPYKKIPSVYNVFFDGIGVAINIQNIVFEGQIKRVRGGRIVANILQSVLLFPFGIGSWWWNPVKVYDKR